MGNNKSNLAKNTILLSICTLLNKGLLFVMVPLFSRWLTVEEYGSYDVLATYVSLLIPIITLASSNAVFRLSVDKDELKFKKFYISNGFFIVTINLFLSVLIISFFSVTFVWRNNFAFVLLVIGEVLDNYFQGYLRAIKKLNIYALCKTATVVFTAIMVTLLVRVYSLGINGILLGYAFGFYISDIIIFFSTRYWKYFSPQAFSLQGVKDLVSYSYSLIPNDISWWVINVSDRTIINLVLGTVANGIYAIAYKVPNLCSAVFGVFNISWQEAAIDVINDEDRAEYFNGIYNKMIAILISLCAGILSCNFLLFDYIFDSKYSDARLYTPILVTAIIFSILAQFFGGIQICLKHPKANGITTIIGAATNLVVHLVLVWFIGLYAAALSTLIANMTVSTLRKRMLKKDFKFSVSHENIVLSIFYLYFVAMAFFDIPLFLGIANFILASILFGYINKSFVYRFLFLRWFPPKLHN
jgi:O-antigen/teichoic acid export membrane protein